MPKAVREVKSFNLGIVSSADDNDIKVDAAVYSENIDANAVQGRLKGRYGDSLLEIPKWRGNFVFNTPDANGDGNIPREVDVKYYDPSGTQLTGNSIYGDEAYYKLDVTLQGTVPTATTTVRFTIADFNSVQEPMSGYVKMNDTANTSGYPNSGEYIELNFSASNWQTVQSVYLIPVNTGDSSDKEFTLQCTVNSTDSAWTHSDRDFNTVFNYVSDVVAGVIIKESTFKLHNVAEGLMEEFQIQVKLTESPVFQNSTSALGIRFQSSNGTKLKVDKTSSGESTVKVLQFTNANWDTYQTIYPYGVDDGVKDGTQVYHIAVSAITNGSVRYDELESNIQNCVKFDTGNFVTNDFTHNGSSDWPVVVLESGQSEGDDDGTDDDHSEDEGWKP
tara:strand:+ start:3739 stop:4908 length:1170 start_codon:yes stop_codon:yes gene_type:complete